MRHSTQAEKCHLANRSSAAGNTQCASGFRCRDRSVRLAMVGVDWEREVVTLSGWNVSYASRINQSTDQLITRLLHPLPRKQVSEVIIINFFLRVDPGYTFGGVVYQNLNEPRRQSPQSRGDYCHVVVVVEKE